MSFWVAAALLAVAAVLPALWPLLRRGGARAARADYDMEIYRDQLREVARDRERGVLDPEEAGAMRAEIERRMLRAAEEPAVASGSGARNPLLAAGVALAICGGAVALYAELGAPGAPDRPLAQRLDAERAQRRTAAVEEAEAGDIESRIALLAERLESDPENFEAWWLLGRSYSYVGRHAEAAEAYRRAAGLSGDRPDVLSAYGEATVLANGNRVSPTARLTFEQILASNPEDPRARYYLALFEAQQQRFQAAMDGWLALLADSPPDAGWVPLVRKNIADMARFLEIDVATVLPDASEAETAGGEDPTAAIAALQARLDAEPKDFRGWIELARRHAAAGDRAAARGALASASELYPGAPFVQQQIRQAAAEIGIDLAAGGESEPEAAGGRSPSREQVAAAAEMSDAERAEMIDGMVAGLAARLESEPDDLDGWVMLIRSYAVLGREDEADTALARALAAFEDRPEARATLESQAGELGLTAN